MRIHLTHGPALAAALVSLAAASMAQGPAGRVTPRGGQQGRPPAEVVTLEQVRALFDAADLDDDRRLSGAEPSVLPWGPQLLRQSDQDGDGAFSLEEFVVSHHRHLVGSGKSVARDLAAESTRTQALWRARRSEELKRLRSAQQRGIRLARPSEGESVRTELVPSDRQTQRVVPERSVSAARSTREQRAAPKFKGPDEARNSKVQRPTPSKSTPSSGAKSPGEARPNELEPGTGTRDAAARSARGARAGPKPAPASRGPAGQRIGTARKPAAPPKDAKRDETKRDETKRDETKREGGRTRTERD